MTNIEKTEAFLKEQFTNCAFFKEHPADGEYRLQHSYRVARPFLEQLDLSKERVQEICYGIAIHVDGKADFPGEKTAFAYSIGDADDVDRFDAYRIYDAMEWADFRNLKIEDKRKWLQERLDWINWRLGEKSGTETARQMIAERLLYQRQYYEKVLEQMKHSERIEQR